MCEELERHMNGCEPCKAFLASLEATIQHVRQVPQESPHSARASALRKEILARLDEAIAEAKR
jgi:hypothetical protein